jgi:hypothetical protein
MQNMRNMQNVRVSYLEDGASYARTLASCFYIYSSSVSKRPRRKTLPARLITPLHCSRATSALPCDDKMTTGWMLYPLCKLRHAASQTYVVSPLFLLATPHRTSQGISVPTFSLVSCIATHTVRGQGCTRPLAGGFHASCRLSKHGVSRSLLPAQPLTNRNCYSLSLKGAVFS